MRLSITEPQLEGARIGDTVYAAQDIDLLAIGVIGKGAPGLISGFDPEEREVGVDFLFDFDGRERTIWRHPNYFDTTRPFVVGMEVREDEVSELPTMTIMVENHTNKAWQVNDNGFLHVVGNTISYTAEGFAGVIVWMP